jgi:hypothetical protein
MGSGFVGCEGMRGRGGDARLTIDVMTRGLSYRLLIVSLGRFYRGDCLTIVLQDK